MIVAAPLALFSQRLGQLRMIQIGAGVFIVGLVVGATFQTVPMILVALTICAIGYASFSVNAIIAVWNTAGAAHLNGLYTGLYAVAYAAGGAAGPMLLGVSNDIAGWPHMMSNAALLMVPVMALFSILVARERRRAASDLDQSLRSSPRESPRSLAPSSVSRAAARLVHGPQLR